MQESKAKNTQFGDMALESTQTGFIQKLLKECRTKVIILVFICFAELSLKAGFINDGVRVLSECPRENQAGTAMQEVIILKSPISLKLGTKVKSHE